ncbi:MAG: GNAT family N-acetyltransferase [Actinomycetota bacterium]|nr:GNAT family N-acetyltransferase [Actinomycetota bacterium]
MARPQILVRRVTAGQHQDLVDLWVDQRVESGANPEATARMVADGTVVASLARPGVVALLALADSGPVGYLVLSDTTTGVFVDAPCVAVDQLYVSSTWRRHGVARHLLSAVAAHADRVGAEQIVGHVPAGLREANRFFARLGFTPTVVRRVTTPRALHRRLARASEQQASLGTLEQVLRRRRSARVRTLEGAASGLRGL